jgi:hypothetical protein
MAEINAQIPLMSQAPQAPDLMQNYSKLMALKNMGQQNQLQGQALQENDLKLQEMKQSVNDNLTARQILAETGGDVQKAGPKLYEALGPKAAPVVKTLLEQAQAMATFNESQRKVASEKAAAVSSAIDDTFAETDATKRPQIWANKLAQLSASGTDISKFPQTWDDEMMRGTGSILKQTQNALDLQAKNQAIKKGALDITAATQKVEGKEPIQPAEAARIAESKIPPSYREYMLSGSKLGYDQWLTMDANRKKPTTVNQFGQADQGIAGLDKTLEGIDYFEAMRKINPSYANRVKGIVEGRENPPSGRAAYQGAGDQYMKSVYQMDPGWTFQRAQIRKAFTTGKDGTTIGNINTAIVHLGRMGVAGQKLNNSSFTPGNEFYNYMKDKFGSETVTNFGLLKDAVAGEMAAALKGTATDIEIEKMGKSIRSANSPQQMAGIINEGMSVLADKAKTFDERYHQQSPDDPWTPFLPTAQSFLDAYGVKPMKANELGLSGSGSKQTVRPAIPPAPKW